MKSDKTRHQLFLPEEMNGRLEHLAKNSGRAQSEILVETLYACFNLRQAPKSDEVIGIRLTRIERKTDWMRRNQAPLREVRARVVLHQLVTGAMEPVKKVARAASPKLFAQLIDKIADRFAGNAAPANDDPHLKAEEFAMSREHGPFKNTELPSPNMLDPIALRVSCRTPGPHAERRGAPASHRWSYTGGGS